MCTQTEFSDVLYRHVRGLVRTCTHKEVHTYTKYIYIYIYIFSQQKMVFVPVFLRKSNSFRGHGGSCWPIGVTPALLGRMLPAVGHKLVKQKHGNLGAKVPQIVHFLTGRVILNSYQEIIFRETTVRFSRTSHRFPAGKSSNKVRHVF